MTYKIISKTLLGIYTQIITGIIVGIILCFVSQDILIHNIELYCISIKLNTKYLNIFVKPAIVILTEIITVLMFRKRNSNKSFNGGDKYSIYFYFNFWLASKILGYKYCTLKNTPIFMQFKLILRKTFDYYLTGDELDESKNELLYTDDNSKPVVKIINGENHSSTLNLVLQDTFEIKDSQLPSNVFDELTLFVKRSKNVTTVRYRNRKFINEIKKQLHSFEGKIDTIIIYATTNPFHTKHIVSEIFSLGNRTSIKHIYVMQQNKDNWLFNKSFKVK